MRVSGKYGLCALGTPAATVIGTTGWDIASNMDSEQIVIAGTNGVAAFIPGGKGATANMRGIGNLTGSIALPGAEVDFTGFTGGATLQSAGVLYQMHAVVNEFTYSVDYTRFSPATWGVAMMSHQVQGALYEGIQITDGTMTPPTTLPDLNGPPTLAGQTCFKAINLTLSCETQVNRDSCTGIWQFITVGQLTGTLTGTISSNDFRDTAELGEGLVLPLTLPALGIAGDYVVTSKGTLNIDYSSADNAAYDITGTFRPTLGV